MVENEQKSFILYYSDYELISKLNSDQQANLLAAIFSIGNVCEMPELDTITDMVYTIISRNIFVNRKKWEETKKKRSEAGRKGGKSRNKNNDENNITVESNCEEENDNVESCHVPYQEIMRLYNNTCVSYPKCKTMSEARKKAIRARFNSGYTLDDFKELFEKAEKSSFLRGSNSNNWSASFDWLIKDANMAKVLDGNYDDKTTYSDPDRDDSLDAILF